MSYNSGGKITARVGNWVEEEQLAALTGQARYDQPGSTSRKAPKPMSMTAARVIAHSDAVDSADWRASSREYKRPDQSSRRKKKTRAELREEKIRAQVEAELAKEAKRADRRANRGRYETTAQANFVKPGGFGKIGSRTMKTQSGGAPRNQDEQTYEFGLHARKPTMSKEELKGELGSNYYLNDMPISIYSQRLNDGSLPNSGVTNPSNPFSRSAAFTNDIMDSSVRHAEGMDDPSGKVHGSGAVLAEAAGGGLSTKGVVQRVLAAITKKCGGNAIKALGDIFNKFDHSGDKMLSREELRTGLQSYGVRLSKVDLDQIFAHFDHDRSGTISYDEFLRGVRGSMNASRTALVNSAFTILDTSGAGAVDAREVARKFDASKDAKVLTGEAAPQDVLNEFMSNFSGRRVTKQQFQAYYTDVSASVPRDDIFELMMKNTWGITGDENSGEVKPLKVLIVLKNGKEEQVTVKNAAGLRADDFDKIRARLHKQNIHGVVKITNQSGQSKGW